MKFLLLAVLGVTTVACGSRQSPAARSPADGAPAARPSAAEPAPAIASEEVQPAPVPAPASPTAATPAPTAPVEGQRANFVPTAADQLFVRRMLDVIDEVAAVTERHQNACDRMAADLEIVLRRNQDLIGMAQQMKGNPAREKWMQEQMMDRLNKALPRMMTGFQNCQNDARMQALLKRLAS